MVRAVLSSGCEVHVLRDPTRGGVGTTLNEIAGQSQVGMTLFEKDLPVKKQVRGVCELLGFDPLYLANEGKLIAVVPEKHVRQVLDIIRADEFGGDAVVIGEVTDQNPGKVFLRTAIGGRRLVDMLTGEQLPRIC
jgi:hydrogenase expression/formation protein HypE